MRELPTPRLRLRGFRDGDLPALVAMDRDPEVMRHIRAVGSEEEETRKAAALIAENQDEPPGVAEGPVEDRTSLPGPAPGLRRRRPPLLPSAP